MTLLDGVHADRPGAKIGEIMLATLKKGHLISGVV